MATRVKNKMEAPACPKGRPREFKLEKALDAAVAVFWEKGYDAASLPDLTRAMGINRPSLYAAFGNKESLFKAALDRYTQTVGCYTERALSQPHVRDAVLQLLAPKITCAPPPKARGCLLLTGGLVGPPESLPVRQDLARRRAQVEHAIRDRLVCARTEGQLRPGTNINALAKFITTVRHGLIVQRTTGDSPSDLNPVVTLAMQVLETHLTP